MKKKVMVITPRMMNMVSSTLSFLSGVFSTLGRKNDRAMAAGCFWTVCEFMAMANAIVECEPDVDMYIIWAAVPSALIPAAYGIIVYFISLIIRITRKPKM